MTQQNIPIYTPGYFVATDQKKPPKKKRKPPPDEKRCVHYHSEEQQCSVRRMHGFDFCYFHEPSYKELRLENSKKGGNTTAKLPESMPEPAMQSMEDVRQFTVETLHQVRTGQMEPRTAAVVSSLVAHVLKTLPEADANTLTPAQELRALLTEEDDVSEQAEDDEAGESMPHNGSGQWPNDPVQGL